MKTKPNKSREGKLWRKVVMLAGVLLLLLATPGWSVKDGGETAGNNLSFPVIWSEGVTKVLPGTAGMTPILNGEWWYWWGTSGVDPDIIPLSCPPDPDDETFCDDRIAMQASGPAPGEGWVKAYLQKDAGNLWQAGSVDMSAAPLVVHWIDWGDNLESVDWYTRSQVRTEVVLFQDLSEPMLEYEMRHVSGWGIDEVHGLAVANETPQQGLGGQATVFSPCARLTIQKLLVERSDPQLVDGLQWVPGVGWEEVGFDDLINPAIFNGAVHEAGDGPGYYNAEINVKGRIIYGYTWNVRKLNDGAGDYRVTFSFDETCGSATRNVAFGENVTQIMVPLEEEEVVVASEEGDDGGDTGGAAAVLDTTNNLTYIDVRILERSGGGNGGGKPADTPGGGSGGGNAGGNPDAPGGGKP